MLNKINSLTPEAYKVLVNKGTEHPGTGIYNEHEIKGTYLCRQCGLALFRSSSKFTAGCGWPSFDDEIEGNILRVSDADGRRTEILCNRCQGHMGHVFVGEGHTGKNLRHCVNSLALDFVENLSVMDTEEAIVAGGCFWGVEYYMQQLPGVCLVESGYIGGKKPNPTYREVCKGDSGHIEAVRVLFDPIQTNYEAIIKLFLEIHDPTQKNGQGPDIGEQYQSAIFYYDQKQKDISNKCLAFLKQKGLSVVTNILPVMTFWRAEEFHQNYYAQKGTEPYCHHRVERFKD